MLFDPFEKQFDLPAKFVQPGNRPWRQAEVVGQKQKSLVQLGIDVVYSPQKFGIIHRTFGAGQSNSLIAAQPAILVYRTGFPACKSQIVFGPNHEERLLLMNVVQPPKIDESFVHDIEGPGLEQHMIEKMHIVLLTACNADKHRNIASQIELRMHFDGTFVAAMLSPREQRQAQIDDGGIQRIDCSLFRFMASG